MDSSVLSVYTADRTVTDLTVELERFCAGRGDGLVNAFAPHATAGMALMEVGAGSGRCCPETTATSTGTGPGATVPTTSSPP